MGRKLPGEKMPPLARGMLAVLLAGGAVCALFGALYRRTGRQWALTLAITGGMFAYHMAVRFLAPVLLTAFTRRRYDCRSRWFRPKPWEARLYEALGVKNWKKRALTYQPREFSLAAHTPEEVVSNTCHAEAVHELSILLGALSLLFAIPFGSFWAFFATALLSALLDGAAVAIQRYNRPRLLRLAERRSRRYSQRS